MQVININSDHHQNSIRTVLGAGLRGDDPMRNRADKDTVRRCHLTHQFIGRASVHSREHKTRGADVYPYFVSKRFINRSIITNSCQACTAHLVMHKQW